MEITLSGGTSADQTGEVASGAALASWIDRFVQGRGQSLILSKSPEVWIQSVPDRGGYRVEKRDGGEARHYSGVAKAAPVGGARTSAGHFTADEVQLLFEDYLNGRTSSYLVEWQKLPEGRPMLNPWVRIYRGLLLFAVFLLVSVGAIWIMDGFYFE